MDGRIAESMALSFFCIMENGLATNDNYYQKEIKIIIIEILIVHAIIKEDIKK